MYIYVVYFEQEYSFMSRDVKERANLQSFYCHYRHCATALLLFSARHVTYTKEKRYVSVKFY